MADIAKFKLITSLGVVLAGEDIPAKLPGKEYIAIKDAGGIVAETGEKKSIAQTPDDSERKVAELALEDAKVALSKAVTDEEKAEAQKKLAEAEDALDLLL